MRVYKRVFCVIISLMMLTSCAKGAHKGSESSLLKGEHTISFDKESVMERPGELCVTYGGKTLTARENNISWAHAVNDDEWSSLNEAKNESIDGPYEDKFLKNKNDDAVRLKFEAIKEPDVVVYIRRYPVENWVEDPELKNSEGLKLREVIEHHDDYNEYETIDVPDICDECYVFYLDPDSDRGYIYEVKAVWDTELYRGSCIYSFMIAES